MTMEKRAVVETEAEKEAHEKIVKTAAEVQKRLDENKDKKTKPESEK